MLRQEQAFLKSVPEGADLALDGFSRPKESPEVVGGGQRVAAGEELLPGMDGKELIVYAVYLKIASSTNRRERQ